MKIKINKKLLKAIINEQIAFVLSENLQTIREIYKYPLKHLKVDSTLFNNLQADPSGLEQYVLSLYKKRTDIGFPKIKVSVDSNNLNVSFSYKIDNNESPLSNQKNAIKKIIIKYINEDQKIASQEMVIYKEFFEDPFVKAYSRFCYGAEGFDPSYKVQPSYNAFNNKQHQTRYLSQSDIDSNVLNQCDQLEKLIFKINNSLALANKRSKFDKFHEQINKFYNLFVFNKQGVSSGEDIDKKVKLDLNTNLTKAFIVYKRLLASYGLNSKDRNTIVNFIKPKLNYIVDDFHNSHLSSKE